MCPRGTPTRPSVPPCSRPSRTLRAAGAVARRRAILDRRCARRPWLCAGRGGRMVPIEQKDGTRVGVDMVDFPLPLPVRCIVSGKRKWHYFCDHHLSWSADRAKTAFVLLCFAHHIACIKFSLTIPDLFVYNWCRAVVGHLR